MIDFIIDILQDIANLLEGVRDKNPPYNKNKKMQTIAILLLILSIIIGLNYYSK